MATPTLQDVLAAVPAVAQLVDSMTELMPGVPANEQNLQTLWTYLQGVPRREYASNELLVVLERIYERNGVYQELDVRVMGKPVDCRRDHRTCQLRPILCEETHKNTGEGLLQCLLFARQSLRRYIAEGTCPGCCSADLAPLPERRLKAAGMPRCADCMLKAVISGPPSKRARSSRE